MTAGTPDTRAKPDNASMKPAHRNTRLSSLPAPRPRRTGTWRERIFRSNSFAWGLSVTLHATVFLSLYCAVFRESAMLRGDIIPEARLASLAQAAEPPETVPLRIAEPAEAAPKPDRRHVDELPVAVVNLDKPPSLSLPGGAANVPSASLASAMLADRSPHRPVSRFFGLTGNAYKVVYVVDVSASLMIYIQDIAHELRDSVQALVPTQRFHIVLAKPRHVEEFAPRRLVPAIKRYKTEAFRFIRQVGTIPEPGKADPIEAMRCAFAVEPELIYFLTDGDYPDMETDLEQTLQQLNTNGYVKITTIGFGPSPKPRTLLERIARQHGGNCRFLEPK